MRQSIQRALALAIALSASAVIPAVQANHHEHKDHQDHAAPTDSKTSEASSGLINGEVRRIDTENRKITIKHEAIPEFEMAAMTMVFRVADSIALEKLNAGDKIRFSLSRREGKWLVTSIEN